MILYKSKTVDIFIVRNKMEVKDPFTGPIELYRLLPQQYLLMRREHIKKLIQHLGAALQIIVKSETQDEQDEQDEQIYYFLVAHFLIYGMYTNQPVPI